MKKRLSIILAILLQALVTRSSLAAQSTPSSLRNYVPAESEYPTVLSGVVAKLKAAHAADEEHAVPLYQSALDSLVTGDFGRGAEDERLFLIGYTRYHLKQYPEAIDALQRSLAIRDGNPLARFFLGAGLQKAGRCEESLKELDVAKWLLNESNSELLLTSAECLVALGRQPEAQTVLDEANKLAGANSEIKKLIVSLRAGAIGSGAPEAVLQSGADLTVLAKENPNDRQIQGLYAKMLIHKGDPLLNAADLDEGERVAKNFAESSNYTDEQAVKLVFDARLKHHDYDGAREVVEMGLKAVPQSTIYATALKQLSIEETGLQTLRYSIE